MDYPYGHHHRHQHRRDEDDSDEYRSNPYPPPSNHGGSYGGSYGGDYRPPPSYGGDYPPPPPSYGGDYPPPPPHVAGVYHSSHMESPNYPSYGGAPHMESPNYPSYGGAPHMESPNYPPPPEHHNPSFNRHESHGGEHHGRDDGDDDRGSHRFRPHMPAFIAEHFHHSSSDVGPDDGPQTHEGGYSRSNLEEYFANKPSFKIYCRGGGDAYSVAIRDDKVVLTYSDPSDPTQHWYKDEKYSTKVKDEDGYPSFALVNKGTGQAIKHSASAHPVQLVPYNPDALDVSILWTDSKDLGSGFRTIRMVNNTHLVLDAFNGDKDHGGIRDGIFLALFRCWKGDNVNQQWKLYPHSRE